MDEIFKNKKEIEDYLGKIHITPKTTENYFSSLKRVLKLLGKDYPVHELSNSKQVFDDFKNALNQIENISSRKTITNNTIKLFMAYNLILKNDGLDDTIELMAKAFKEYAKKVDENKEFHAPSEKDIDNKIEWDTLIQAKEKLREVFEKDLYRTKNDVKYMLLSLYCFCPLRQQDYINTNIYNNLDDVADPEVSNYISLDDKKLFIKKYKTEKKHGTRVLELPDDLINVIKRFMDKSKQNKLLPQILNNKKYMTSEQCTGILSEALKIKAPVQTLRRVFISKFYKELQTGKEMKAMAKKMGHNQSTAYQIYNIYSIIANEEETMMISNYNNI